MSRTAGELAEHLGAQLAGDSCAVISGVAGPERAGPNDLIYLDSPKNQERAASSAAHCVLARPKVRLAGKTVLEAGDPKFAFAKAAAWLASEKPVKGEIHTTAIVASSAKLGPNVHVGPYVVIEEDVRVDEGTTIEAFCFLGHGSEVGAHSRLHPRVTLYAGAKLGAHVEVHAGAVIGGDGFGYAFGEGRHWKFPQIGHVEIGDDVEIGCNTTIDRGSLEDTRISRGVKIDNLVQVAHNVQIGEHCVLAAQTGISGSTVLGNRVLLGGQAGVVVGKTVRKGQTVWGTPARPLEKFKEQYAWVSRLPELADRLRKLEQSEKTAE